MPIDPICDYAFQQVENALPDEEEPPERLSSAYQESRRAFLNRFASYFTDRG